MLSFPDIANNPMLTVPALPTQPHPKGLVLHPVMVVGRLGGSGIVREQIFSFTSK